MFNKTEIMTRANAIRKDGYTLSEALKRAWTEAKIKNIENDMFYINMADRLSSKDRDALQTLYAKSCILKRNLKPTTKRNPKLTDLEASSIEERMTKIFNTSKPDWEEYMKLDARLYITQ